MDYNAEQYCDKSYEPMDVDLSAHSTSVMDISYTSNIDLSIVKTEPPEDVFVSENSFDGNPVIINKLVLNNVRNRSISVTTKINKNRQPMILLSITILVSSIVAYQLANFNCCESFDVYFLRRNLMTKVHGQTIAITSIINALELKENRKLLLFYGGTGVGKTFTTSLILQNLLDHKNVYHYTMPSFLQTFSSELLLGLLFCKTAVFVVDDLSRDDMLSIKPLLEELLLKSKKLSKHITIILIFNCDIINEDFQRKCDESFITELTQSLEDLDSMKYFMKFEPLTEKHLRSCIEDELADEKMNPKIIEVIMKKFNVTIDGCKGVHQKLQYMKIL